MNNTRAIILQSGAMLDLSGLSNSLALQSHQTLSNVAPTATVKCASRPSQGLQLGPCTLALNYQAGVAAIVVTNGRLTIATNTVVTVNNVGPALAPGGYRIVSRSSSGNRGRVVGTVPPVTVTGNGASGSAKLRLINGDLYLCIGESGVEFFVSPDGLDSNEGTTPSSPWRSLTNINNLAFEPGDKIHLKAGGVWNGYLWLNGSGTSNAPIVIDSYGVGPKPVIDAQGATDVGAVNVINQEYWTVADLELANWSTNYATRFGIFVFSNDEKDKHGIKLLNNTVRDVFGSPIRVVGTNTFPSFYAVGGIYVRVEEPARGEDILIQGNVVSNIVGEGICYWGESEMVGYVVDWSNLAPGIVVRSNFVSRTAGDGILILGTEDELVEHNVVGYVGTLGVTGTDYVAGMWPTRHFGGVWQFNEVHHTKTWLGDGQGFDNDGFATGTTIFQYNYSHDNEGGFILDCWKPDDGTTVARYNISVNESVGDFYRNNAQFYNNVFYSPTGALDIRVHTAAQTNAFYNNIFWCTNLGPGFASQILGNNLYCGGVTAPTNDSNGIAANPAFSNPNALGLLDGFKLMHNSPCIGSGMLIQSNGGFDFWGYPVSPTAMPNRGADNSTFAPMLNPTNISVSLDETNLTLTWPGDHSGWTLMRQTNHLTTGISTDENDWERIPGTQTTNQFQIPHSYSLPAAFFRLVHP
jgi:hypothetical protein